MFLTLVYIVLMIILSLLFIGLFLLPFWKVHRIIRLNHPALWDGLGRPDFKTVLTDPDTRKLFMRVVNLSEYSKEEIEHDQDLINHTRACKALIRMVPESLIWRVLVGSFILILILVTATNILGIFL